MANSDGWIFWYNQRWYEYTGQSVHDPATLPHVLERWQRSIADGKPFEMTFPLKSADGTFHPFLTRIAPLRDVNGKVVRWLGVNTDVSDERRNAAILERLVEERTAALTREVEERRRTEESLRHSEKLQALGELTGGVAHDFNNIIQVFAASVSMMKRQPLSDDKRGLILDRLTRVSDNARALVERLLAFGRRQPLRPDTLNINECVENSAKMLESTLGSHVNIVVELASDLWPVYVDPSQLEVAVLNLALNARDAMAEKSGGVLTLRTYNIRLDAAPERATGDYVCVEVRDTGDGMTQDVLSRIFEPFFTTKKLGQGTGLGLPQVHGFIKQSDGDIEVKSVLGDGTLIFLYLPRTHAESSRAGENLPLTQGATLSHGSCKTVLVVEDNADVSRTTTILLEHLGYKTLCAMSVAEALEILQTKTAAIDVVLSDVAMPGMNGIELARVLRLRHPSLPVVLATGYSELLTRWPEDISTDILRKPYQLEHLAAALERAFARVDATS